MACPTEIPPCTTTRSTRPGKIRILSFKERARLVEYRHARALDRIEGAAGRFVISDGRITLYGQRSLDGWTVTDGTDTLITATVDQAEQYAWDWLRFGGYPLIRPVVKPQAPVEEITPVPTRSETQERPWTRQEPIKTGRTCRRVRKQKNQPLALYRRPRST